MATERNNVIKKDESDLQLMYKEFEAEINERQNQRSLTVRSLASHVESTISKRNALKTTLDQLDNLYSVKQRFDLSDFVHWRGNSATPMHRWLRYREAYSPELIEKLDLGRRILDPFCGCGSIPIGAATRNRRALGIDLNPIAAFSSKVKLKPLTDGQLKKINSFLHELPHHIKHNDRAPLPGLSISTKVFEPEILESVLSSRTALDSVFCDDPGSRDFVFLAWLSNLETVGSYFKEGNGIKYRNKKRQKGKYENRPDGEWQLARFGTDQTKYFADALTRQLNMMLEDSSLWSSGSWKDQKVVEGSAFALRDISGRRRFDSVIFSPPYANRFDYFEAFKVELWFGGFINSYEELNALRKSSLRSHLNADFKRPASVIEPLEHLLDLMDKDASSWRMGVADLVRGYFHDIRIVLEQCREVMPHGRCHVVVGNSAFAGVIIPTDVLTAMVGLEAGFKKARIIETRHLTVAPQQRSQLKGFEQYMRESIVILE